MNTTTLRDDATALGLTVYIDDGRVKIEGRTGDIIKAYAAQGCDVERDSATTYKVSCGGQYAACIVHGSQGLDVPEQARGIADEVSPQWAYSFTARG